jgi:uncharacterized protein (TIGR02996 family)
MGSTLNLNTKIAAETKLNFLLAAAQGNGDLTALLVYADWLEDNGNDRRGSQVRKRAQHYAGRKGRTVCGDTWLRWHVAYELGVIAEGLIKEVGFRRFRYLGNYNENGSMTRDDGSMEYQLARGWVLPLRRSSKRKAKLGRIIEGLGYEVFWVG